MSAKEANVSLAAASVFAATANASASRRVVEASRKLGWRRNLLVNGMQTGRTSA